MFYWSFINVLLKFKGYDKKNAFVRVNDGGDLGSNIHKSII